MVKLVVNCRRMILIAVYSLCFFQYPGVLPEALDNYLLTIIVICTVFPPLGTRKE